MSGIFFIIGFAFLLGFALIFATSMSKKKRFDGIGTITAEQLPSFTRFSKICADLVEAMKLDIQRIEASPEESSVDIYARNPAPITGGDLLIHAVLAEPGQTVSAAEIVELSNVIIQDRLTKGIFITTAGFTPELSAISELAPMEFIDGKKLEELAQKYRIPLSS